LQVYFAKPEDIRALVSRVYFHCFGDKVISLRRVQSLLNRNFGKTIHIGFDPVASIYSVVFRAIRARVCFEEFLKGYSEIENITIYQASKTTRWHQLIIQKDNSHVNDGYFEINNERGNQCKFPDSTNNIQRLDLSGQYMERSIPARRKIGHSNLKRTSNRHFKMNIFLRKLEKKLPSHSFN